MTNIESAQVNCNKIVAYKMTTRLIGQATIFLSQMKKNLSKMISTNFYTAKKGDTIHLK